MRKAKIQQIERERKFFVIRRPEALTSYPHRLIRQGYIAVAGPRSRHAVEVRLRDEAGSYTITAKSGSAESRTELEEPVSPGVFRLLWPITAGKRIEKIRYRIPIEELTIELDVYRGRLRGLMTAEIEFRTMRQLRRFAPPAWFSVEVTGRPAFSNSNLAIAQRLPALVRSKDAMRARR